MHKGEHVCRSKPSLKKVEEEKGFRQGGKSWGRSQMQLSGNIWGGKRTQCRTASNTGCDCGGRTTWKYQSAASLEGQRTWKETMSVNSVGHHRETTVFIHILVGVSFLQLGNLSKKSHSISGHFQTMSTVSSLGKHKCNSNVLLTIRLLFSQLKSDSCLCLGTRIRKCRQLLLLSSSKLQLPIPWPPLPTPKAKEEGWEQRAKAYLLSFAVPSLSNVDSLSLPSCMCRWFKYLLVRAL